MKPEVLALIPARGGSKGVPRKNIRIVAGKPLIAYSIAQALASRHITRTIVSTDDAEIAEIARQFGAEVPFLRPAEYAQDLSPDIDVFRHALRWLAENENYHPELVVHLRPPGPVRKVELIDQAIEAMLADAEADSLRSIAWPIQTPYKMWRKRGKYLEPLLQVEGMLESYNMPRQSLPEVFWQCGYVDIVRPRTVLELGMMSGYKVLPFFVDEPLLEIDHEEDIPVVEAVLREIEKGHWPERKGPQRRYAV